MRIFRMALVGLALLGLASAAPAPDTVLARLGPVTVSATALAPGPGGTLTASVQVSTSGQPSDQLDAATAADGAPVAVYHQQVNVGELPDLSGCGAENPVAGRGGHLAPLRAVADPGTVRRRVPARDRDPDDPAGLGPAARHEPGHHLLLRPRRFGDPAPARQPRVSVAGPAAGQLSCWLAGSAARSARRSG